MKIGASLVKEPSSSDLIIKELRVLGKICHLSAINKDKYIENEKKQELNHKIRELNDKLDLTIEELTEEYWTDERGRELKAWWKIIHTKAQQERRKEDSKAINIRIEDRCAAIKRELKHMLSSLLERSSNRIQIDRVLVEREDDIALVTEEHEVQNEVRTHFSKQFRKRNIDLSKLTNE